MNENLRTHAYRYDSPQITEPFIAQVAAVATPVTQTCDRAVVLLEGFHFGAVLDVDCEYCALTVAYEQLSLAGVEDHAGQFISWGCESSINA
jgi:hypothetical protein